MTVTYETISDSRPRIRRDVLFTQTPTGVIFHNAHGGFNLNGRTAYRFASLIVPHLNGSNTVGEICAHLPETQRAMVAHLVSTLYSRGFARDVVPGADGMDLLPDPVAKRFAAQIGYVDHYVGEAGTRFARFRDTRVAVLGRDAVAAWCVLSLVRNGSAGVAVLPGGTDPRFAQAREEAAALAEEGSPTRVETLALAGAEPAWPDLAGYDVVVAAGSARTLLRLVEAGVPEGVDLLPVWTFGDRAVVGPLTARGVAGCWTCAALRLGANEERAAAALWSEASIGAADSSGEARLTGPLAAMLGNLVGYEVFRLRTGALAAETRGKVVVQDLDSLDVVSEPLLPHPRCPHCRADEAPGGARVPEPVELTESAASAASAESVELTQSNASAEEAGPPAVTAEPAGDGDAALAELERRAVLVGPRAGVFGDYADDAWEQTPLKAGTVTVGSGSARRDVTAFDVHHVAGARLRALRTAAAVYAERTVPLPGVLRGADLARALDSGLPQVDPAAVGTASGTGAPAEPIADWVPAVSLVTGEGALLPAGAVRTFGAFNADLAWAPTSAGTGVGGSRARAAARGLLGALSYRALTEAVHGRVPVRRVSLDSLAGDPESVFLTSSAKNLGLRLELLDLGGAQPDCDGVPVLLARAADPATGEWRWALGASVSWREAAVDAMRDVLGAAQVARQSADGVPVDTGDPVLADFAPGTLAVTGECGAGDDAPGGWAGVRGRLAGSGLDALLARSGSADLLAGGLHVVRVVLVPGRARAL
jgi:bacteriocin biosynthesis cyclodehydratase domain-containing protein